MNNKDKILLKTIDIVNNTFVKQTLKYIYSILTENLKFAEGKHSVLIALNGALAVFISGYLTSQINIVKILSVLIIIFAVISLSFNFLALFSRNIKYKKNIKFEEKELNLIFYKHIINFSYENYLEEVKKMYDFPKEYKFDGLDKDLSKQIIAISKTTNFKFTFFNYSLFFLLLELILTIFNICLVGMAK